MRFVLTSLLAVGLLAGCRQDVRVQLRDATTGAPVVGATLRHRSTYASMLSSVTTIEECSVLERPGGEYVVRSVDPGRGSHHLTIEAPSHEPVLVSLTDRLRAANLHGSSGGAPLVTTRRRLDAPFVIPLRPADERPQTR